MDTLKCYVCKKSQPICEFQTYKSCQTCRKKKSKQVPIQVPIQSLEPVISIQNSLVLPIVHQEPETKSNVEWCLLSNKWIRRGEEQRLHKLLLKKVHRQFLVRCAFPIHKYLTKPIMVDIRDL